MDVTRRVDISTRFGKAYFSRDPAALAQVLTEDAEWHFAFGSDAPDGRVRTGVNGFLQGIAENDALFAELRFTDVVVRGIPGDQLLMTCLVEGRYREGKAPDPAVSAFSLRGLELVTVRDGRVARKDVFWKQFRAE